MKRQRTDLRNYVNALFRRSPDSDGANSGGLRLQSPDDWNRVLLLVRNIFLVLLLIQGARAGLSVARTQYTLHTMERWTPSEPRPKSMKELEPYAVILEKGVLGQPPKEQPIQLFGILGRVALLGGDPGQVKEYEVGASLPSGETVTKVSVEAVELEKEGKSRTLTVFPDRKK